MLFTLHLEQSEVFESLIFTSLTVCLVSFIEVNLKVVAFIFLALELLLDLF